VVGKPIMIHCLLVVISTTACATHLGAATKRGIAFARNRGRFLACQPAPTPALPRASDRHRDGRARHRITGVRWRGSSGVRPGPCSGHR
jgi:hypothetical protein